MLRPPPANRHVVQDDVGESHDSDYGAQCRSLPGIDQIAPQHEIGDEKEPQHKRRRQARVPGPPDTPYGLGPKWSRHQHTAAKDESHFGRGHGQIISIARAPEQITETAQEYQEIGNKGRPRAAHVQIKDPLHLAHGELLRGIEKDHVEGCNQEHQGQDEMCSWWEDPFHNLCHFIEHSQITVMTLGPAHRALTLPLSAEDSVSRHCAASSDSFWFSSLELA